MAGRDRREDPGQYYPGGRVVPKTPTGQGGGGTSDYDNLANKPKINNHELTGNKTAAQLGLATPEDIPHVIGKLPLRALPPYLHYIPFDDTYPADAAWLYAQLGPSDIGRCSAVRRGGKLWRNYDWTFDDAAEFVVKMSGNATRFASVGVASVGSRLTENDVMSAVNSRYYKCLPGMTLDGINEKGVVCEINVDGGPKTGWHGTGANALHILAAVRWVLDHGETAAQAAEHLAENVIQPQGEMNFHFMVADATSTYIVENGKYALVASGDSPVLTNFRVLKQDEDDPPIYAPEDAWETFHAGSGYERYELLRDGNPITDANFTNAYQSGNDWDSDFESAAQHADAILQWAEQGTDKEAHRGKTSESGLPWWQSVHTTEYDFAAKTMRVAVQEVDDWYTFAVGQANVETDNTVTRTSANPVKSSGIWSAIWGALTALPTGFSSLYDWCVSKLVEKRDKDDRAVYKLGMSDFVVTHDGTSGTVRYIGKENSPWSGYRFDWGDNSYDVFGGYVWIGYNAEGRQGWTLDFNDGIYYKYSEAAEDALVIDFGDGWVARRASVLSPVPKDDQQLAAVATDNEAKPANDDIVKYDAANDRFVKAEKSSTSSDPANADYRDPKDNTCHKTEFGEWTFSDGVVRTLYYAKGTNRNNYFSDSKTWVATDNPEQQEDLTIYGIGDGDEETATRIEQFQDRHFEPISGLSATRSAVCTDGKKFTTFDIVSALVNGVKTLLGNVALPFSTFAEWIASKFDTAKAVPEFSAAATYEVGEIVLHDGVAYKCVTAITTAEAWTSAHWTAASDADLAARLKMLKSDGTATDDFATDIIGKPVAKAKLQTIEDEPTVTSGAVTLKDGAASTVPIGSLASLDITFDEARNGGLRLCELYITGVTAETIPDLTFDAETVSFVATGDSFPACEAGINYFVFAEVAANLWKVTRETLKSITTPTPVAAA